MEQASLKTNWTLAERLLHKQLCKKEPPRIEEEGKKSNHQVGTCAPGRAQRGRVTQAEILPGSEQCEPHTGCPSPGVWQGRQALAYLGGHVGLTRGSGKLRLCLWGLQDACMLPRQGGEGDWEHIEDVSPVNSPAPLASQCSSTGEWGLPRWSRELSRETQVAQTQSNIWAGKGQLSLMVARPPQPTAGHGPICTSKKILQNIKRN